MPKCHFNKVALKFGLGVLLQICYIFPEHLFLRTPWRVASENKMSVMYLSICGLFILRK